MNKLIFATANRHKLEEIRAMLPDDIQIISLFDIGFTDEIPETETTIEGNAMQKARYINERYQLPCFADDSGLEVDALGGAPGVYSSHYAEVEGSSEVRAKANISKLLNEMSGKTNRKARFKTVIAYIDANNDTHLFEGIVDGIIIETPTGIEGFGYDPVFIPEGRDVTFAQMPLSEKNAISHRAKAFNKFANAIKQC